MCALLSAVQQLFSTEGLRRSEIRSAGTRLFRPPFFFCHAALKPRHRLKIIVTQLLLDFGFEGHFKMSQFQLTLATKANQAALLPVLLVATSVNEARPSPIVAINYEDVAVLPRGDKAVVEFVGASGTPAYGSSALEELRATFPYLNSKEEKLVSRPPPHALYEIYEILTALRKMTGSPSSMLLPRSTSKLSTRNSRSSTIISSCGPLSLDTLSPPRTLPSGVPSAETVFQLAPLERGHWST